MSANDVINVRDIRTSDGGSFVRFLLSATPNIIWTDNQDGSWTIDAASLGGGDVFRNANNNFGTSFTQTFGSTVHSEIELDGQDVATRFQTVETAATSAGQTADTALTAANQAQSTADNKLEAPVLESQLSGSVQTKLNQTGPSFSASSGVVYMDANGANWSSNSAGKVFSFDYNLVIIGTYQKISGKVRNVNGVGSGSSIDHSNFRYSDTPGFSGFSSLQSASVTVTPYENAVSGDSRSSYAYGLSPLSVGINVSLQNSGDNLLGYSIVLEGTV